MRKQRKTWTREDVALIKYLRSRDISISSISIYTGMCPAIADKYSKDPKKKTGHLRDGAAKYELGKRFYKYKAPIENKKFPLICDDVKMYIDHYMYIDDMSFDGVVVSLYNMGLLYNPNMKTVRDYFESNKNDPHKSGSMGAEGAFRKIYDSVKKFYDLQVAYVSTQRDIRRMIILGPGDEYDVRASDIDVIVEKSVDPPFFTISYYLYTTGEELLKIAAPQTPSEIGQDIARILC